ncbi:thioredoxin family protein [Meiothermus hypogaeus]|uniref:Redox-active disulfide protein 2 n=2 Tax=Meiothermus hypogaeus TaxID=884155 RepID=A0A511R547_9DEIN|nr:thioredoxin family protein [Meiothermus hypogaeus]RIH74161.1 redox-active disulfide protein 2 [Meiothermus hypogaeus]GEM84734.1 redox-active disulfide protein 2 [Meiothermus hypogaeus NBRC 106114]GIW37406.1 MAG: redox-active disulfide protein 2 [Meiothermus sp.]
MNIEANMPQAGRQATIKVLGPGCQRCNLLENHVKQALERMGKPLEVQKITEIPEILAYGVVQTPALVVGEEVLVAGFVPSPRQIQEMLQGKV